MSQPQMSMGVMGGPVGGAGPGVMGVGTPNSSGVGMNGSDYIKRLNTAIYDYMLRNQLYDVARGFIKQMEIETDVKKSPNQRGQQNGVDDSMDVDSKEIQDRPNDLPAPLQLGDGPFLQDWWCQFWEIFQGHRGKGKPATLNYIGIQRNQQKQRTGMMVNGPAVDAATMQRMNAMQNMNNGMGVDLKRAALQNPRNMNPQAMAQYQNMKANQQNAMMGAQMERQGSQMDMTAARTGSPNSGEAPSPKRQRIDGGNMQAVNPARPGPPNQMQGAPSVEHYSQSMQQQMKAAMSKANSNMNKGMPPNAAMAAGQQGSPMSQAGMDGATGDFYAANGAARMNTMANVAGANQNNNNGGNHALQDYQMQLMLLEQQNKKRLLMARQEQDSMTHPGGPGPNGQFPAGMSPQGSRQGDPSPNPNDMQRGTPKVNKAGMSPNGDMAARGSPQPGNMMNPNVPPELRQQMLVNGGQMMRPPSSHPLQGGMTPEQMRLFQQHQQQQNQMLQNGWQGQPPHPGQMMPGQPGGPGGPVGQPGQGPPNMTPRQANQMPPPPAPTAGTQPSSPSQQAPAPPTPSQTNKPKPGGKKEAAKKGASKKGANNAAAAPAPETEQPPTPTPATPITPMNAQSFGQKQNQHMQNGQPQQAPNMSSGNQAQANAVQAPNQATDMSGSAFGNLGEDQFPNMNLDFGPIDGGDVLDNFDFDSFLNTGDGDGGFGFDATLNFGDGTIEAGGDLGANGV